LLPLLQTKVEIEIVAEFPKDQTIHFIPPCKLNSKPLFPFSLYFQSSSRIQFLVMGLILFSLCSCCQLLKLQSCYGTLLLGLGFVGLASIKVREARVLKFFFSLPCFWSWIVLEMLVWCLLLRENELSVVLVWIYGFACVSRWGTCCSRLSEQPFPMWE